MKPYLTYLIAANQQQQIKFAINKYDLARS